MREACTKMRDACHVMRGACHVMRGACPRPVARGPPCDPFGGRATTDARVGPRRAFAPPWRVGLGRLCRDPADRGSNLPPEPRKKNT